MKILVKNAALKLVLSWAQHTLFGGAFLMLGYCGFVAVDAWRFEHWGRQDLERMLQDQTRSAAVPGIGTSGMIGRIEILRLGVSALVIEGTGESILQRATGHIIGTALPGQRGNVGIAGHRDSFFLPLRNIQPDDLITLATLRGEYRYRVVSSTVVDPADVAVLHPDETETLTLVTCYPFYFIGAAPNRFIVRAKRVL
jgi:sortase A